MKKKLSFLILMIFIFTLSGCKAQNRTPESVTGYAFDTIISATLYGENAGETGSKLLVEASRLDNLWNKNKNGSDIYNVNHNAGEFVNVSTETYYLVEKAKEFALESNGCFDPTIGAVSSLWDFKSETPSLPDEALLTKALQSVNYNDLILKSDSDGYKIKLQNPEAQLDIGAIAKGYAGDLLKELCQKEGITSGFINLGGNVIVLGPKNFPPYDSFNVGIKNPSFDNTENNVITAVEMSSGSLVTSGVYERCFELDGVNYHHILDKKTGYPVRNNLLSVSIIGPSSLTSDALSTILFIKGIDEGLAFLKKYPDYKAIFINDQMELIYSD